MHIRTKIKTEFMQFFDFKPIVLFSLLRKVCMHSIPLLACEQYQDILIRKDSKQTADDVAPFRLPTGWTFNLNTRKSPKEQQTDSDVHSYDLKILHFSQQKQQKTTALLSKEDAGNKS